jgi:hypothetical protein
MWNGYYENHPGELDNSWDEVPPEYCGEAEQEVAVSKEEERSKTA